MKNKCNSLFHIHRTEKGSGTERSTHQATQQCSLSQHPLVSWTLQRGFLFVLVLVFLFVWGFFVCFALLFWYWNSLFQKDEQRSRILLFPDSQTSSSPVESTSLLAPAGSQTSGKFLVPLTLLRGQIQHLNCSQLSLGWCQGDWGPDTTFWTLWLRVHRMSIGLLICTVIVISLHPNGNENPHSF